jgi:hypothetical protein
VAPRWKYKTATVTVDENTVTVRGLTVGERAEFAEVSKTLKAQRDAGEASPRAAMHVPRMVAKFGIVAEPPLEDADVLAMPGDLLDAAVTKILELSGVNTDNDEKKDTPAA